MYDSIKYNDQRPNVGVTVVPFIYEDSKIKVLVYKREITEEEFPGCLALPNCFYDRQKVSSAEEAALSALSFKTNISIPHLEQLHTFSGDYIDPNRINTINITYFALLRKKDITILQSPRFQTKWVDIDELLQYKELFAFNHFEVLETAIERIKAKAEYTAVAINLLDEKFSIVDLKSLTELLIGTTLNNSRFRDRIEKSNLLIPCEGEFKSHKTRKAQLYTVNPDNDGFFYPRSLTKPS